MARRLPRLAKLTRPRLHRAVARERLFALLDDAREHKPAICVVGPPGAGKTTLVASWLDARGIEGIWYQVDPGDADLSTFFYYLGEASNLFTCKGRRPLPLLTPEYLHDVEGFSRRFFRELFAWLPESSTLVLDNCHEVAPEQQFHQLIAYAINEVPGPNTLIVISRRDPPDCYARQIANEHVVFVDWDALKLTLEEARSIAAARSAVIDKDFQRLHALSDGWAAGLTLLLEHDRRIGVELDLHRSAGIESVFEYFATQIFDRFPEETREFLMGTAFLPRVAVDVAQRLTGHPGPGDILEDIYRRHLFTHRRPGDIPTYQYHALFQAFLRSRARKSLSATEERKLISRAARLLQKAGHSEDAAQLYQEACDWDSMGHLIRESAPALLAQGRGQTLRDWIGALPLQKAESEPWLVYWLGVSLIAVDQQVARKRLAQAHDKFRTHRDLLGQTLAACGVINSYYFEWSDFTAMPRWIAEIEKILPEVPLHEYPEAELHVYSSLLIAMLYGQPGHPLLGECVERVMNAVDREVDVNSRVMSATFLMSYCALSADFTRGSQLMARIEPLVQRADISALHQLWWRTRLGYFLWGITEYERAAESLKMGEHIAEQHGLAGLRPAMTLNLNYQLLTELGRGDYRAADAILRRAESTADAASRMGAWHRVWSRVQGELGKGNSRPAFEDARAVTAAFESGMVYVQILSLISQARGFADHDSHEKVMNNLQAARLLLKDTCLAHLDSEVLLTEAYSLLRRGDRLRGHCALRNALRHARERGYSYHLRWCSTMSPLCAEALASDIEVDYVRQVIRTYRLHPPSSEIENWPWAVKIFALGRFEVLLEGESLKFTGKAPKKPLALLKALIALGGRNVPEERLMDALWPSEDADAARNSLDITVLRLRKLLGHHDTLIVSDGSMGLNPRLCWTDVAAFEHRAEEAQGLADSARFALPLYRGNFLPADAEAPWTIKARERLRNKFVRLTESVAIHEENAGRREEAIALYLKGLEADDLIEPFYQGLMRCYRALGRHAEAMSTYRRLRHLLSVVLGIAPSDSTQSLARTLQRDNPAHPDSV